MLFLRRFVGEGIFVTTPTEDTHIRLIDIDVEKRTAAIFVEGKGKVTLTEKNTQPLGVGRVKLGLIQSVDGGPPFVSLGLEFPRSFMIRRAELMRGTDALERQAIARAEALGNRWIGRS